MKKSRKTSTHNGQLLEQCIYCLAPIGFSVFDNIHHYDKAIPNPNLCVIKNWPHKTLYGTPGRKEALIVASKCNGNLISDRDGKFRVLIEAKFQTTSGSVDEKFPYIVESCLESSIENWVVVCGGLWWKKGRGQSAVRWLRSQSGRVSDAGKQLIVVEQVKGFSEFITKYWGAATVT